MPAAVGWVLLLWGACCRRATVGCLLLHPSSRCRLVLKVAQSSAEGGMSILVRRLNLNPPLRHRQLRRELVLVVTSTRVALSMIHGLPAL